VRVDWGYDVTETHPAERLAALEAEYARIMAQAATVRTQMLSNRLTRSRKEAQMREATIEEAEDQAAYFEGRTREMEGVVHTDETNLSALTTQAAAVYGQIAEVRVRDALAAFDAIMNDLTQSGEADRYPVAGRTAFDAIVNGLTLQIDTLTAALTQAAPYLRTAYALRDALPASATETRAALAAANDRADNAETLLHELRHQLGLKSTDTSRGS